VVMILRVVVLDVVRVNMAGCQFERASLMKGVRWDGDPRGVGADAISCLPGCGRLHLCRCRAGPGKHPASIALHCAGDCKQLPRTTMELLVRTCLDKEERRKMDVRYLHRV
jgi:hypothetical protein